MDLEEDCSILNSSLEVDSAPSGEDDADSCPLYKDTLDRLKESKKRSDRLEAKIANELAITLTPSVSTESIVLLSTTPQTPTPTCHSAPSSGRSTPSVTWSDHVEVFEIPKRECLENNEEEDEESFSPISSLSVYQFMNGCDRENTTPNSNTLATGNGPSDSSDVDDSSATGTPKTGRKPWAQMIQNGYSPRPKRKNDGRFEVMSAETLSDALTKISGISNGNPPIALVSTQEEVSKNILKHSQMQRDDTLEERKTETDTICDNQKTKEAKVITGILKGGGLDEKNSATVQLLCEESGTSFKTRCIRLRENDEAKIGRCIKTNGTLPDESNAIFDCRVLSRQHASIYYKEGSFYIRDLKSSNGTYLIQDEKPQLPIDKNTCNHTLEIFSGDVIQFGQDVYEGPRSDSNNNDNGRRDQTCVNKCIRARLKLFHPSKVECKSRYPVSKGTTNVKENPSANENGSSGPSFDRSDSLVIHDIVSDKTNNSSSIENSVAENNEQQDIESTSSITIQHLLKSIKNETENISKYFVKQEEGNKEENKSESSTIPLHILEKLETLERLIIVAASHTTNQHRSNSGNGQPKQQDNKNCSNNEEEEVELRPKSMRGRTKQRRCFDDTTLVQKRSNSNFMSYPTIELKGDLRGCIEKCRDLAGVGAAIVAHEGTDTKLGNLADLAGAVTDKIKELEIRLKNEESSILGERLSLLERRTEVSYAMIKTSNSAITYISIFFAMIAILFLLRDGIRENHRRLTAW